MKSLQMRVALSLAFGTIGLVSCGRPSGAPADPRASSPPAEEVLLLAALRRNALRSDVPFSVVDSEVEFTRRMETARPQVVMTWALHRPTDVPHARGGAVAAQYADQQPVLLRDVNDWQRVAPHWSPRDSHSALLACRELLAVFAPRRGYQLPPGIPPKSSPTDDVAGERSGAPYPAPPRDLTDSVRFHWRIWTEEPRGDYLYDCVFSRASGRSVPLLARRDSVMRR